MPGLSLISHEFQPFSARIPPDGDAGTRRGQCAKTRTLHPCPPYPKPHNQRQGTGVKIQGPRPLR